MPQAASATRRPPPCVAYNPTNLLRLSGLHEDGQSDRGAGFPIVDGEYTHHRLINCRAESSWRPPRLPWFWFFELTAFMMTHPRQPALEDRHDPPPRDRLPQPALP